MHRLKKHFQISISRVLAIQKAKVQSLGQEDPLAKRMATHPSILAWRIPWTEAPGGLQSMGLLRVRHSLATSTKHRSNAMEAKLGQKIKTLQRGFQAADTRRHFRPMEMANGLCKCTKISENLIWVTRGCLASLENEDAC